MKQASSRVDHLQLRQSRLPVSAGEGPAGEAPAKRMITLQGCRIWYKFCSYLTYTVILGRSCRYTSSSKGSGYSLEEKKATIEEKSKYLILENQRTFVSLACPPKNQARSTSPPPAAFLLASSVLSPALFPFLLRRCSGAGPTASSPGGTWAARGPRRSRPKGI